MYNGSYGDDIDEREKLLLGILILEPFSEMNPISHEQILIWFFIFYFFLFINLTRLYNWQLMWHENNFLLFCSTRQFFPSKG